VYKFYLIEEFPPFLHLNVSHYHDFSNSIQIECVVEMNVDVALSSTTSTFSTSASTLSAITFSTSSTTDRFASCFCASLTSSSTFTRSVNFYVFFGFCSGSFIASVSILSCTGSDRSAMSDRSACIRTSHNTRTSHATIICKLFSSIFTRLFSSIFTRLFSSL
jgi:hypothetical protein